MASLGSCAAFYAVQYLRTRNLDDRGVEVSVTTEKLKQPAQIGNFRIQVSCPVTLTEEHEQGVMRSVHHCIVHSLLPNPPEITIELTVGEASLQQV